MASFTFPISNIARQRRINPYENIDTSTPNLDALSSHMGEMPDREDYQLGTKDRIINAIIGGMTGFTSGAGKAIDVTRQNYDRPYQQAATDWAMKGRGLSDVANAESRQINSRLRDAQLQEQHLQNIDELDQRAQEAEARRQAASAKLEESNRRTNILDENADALRKQTERHQRAMEGYSKTRADTALARANRPPNQSTRPEPYAYNPKQAEEEAIKSLLIEEPGFEQYFDGLGLRKVDGNPVKLVNGKIFPLVKEDVQAIQDARIKIQEKKNKFLALRRNELSQMSSIPGSIDFSDEDEDEEDFDDR